MELDYTRPTAATVVRQARTTRVHAALDYGEPRKLSVYITGTAKGKADSTDEITLYFESHKMAAYAKNRIEEAHNKAVIQQVNSMIRYFDDCEAGLKKRFPES